MFTPAETSKSAYAAPSLSAIPPTTLIRQVFRMAFMVAFCLDRLLESLNEAKTLNGTGGRFGATAWRWNAQMAAV